jgi:hypothetical protein
MPACSSPDAATAAGTTAGGTGGGPHACAALTATGHDTHWILEPPAGLTVIPSAARVVATGLAGDRAALVLEAALGPGGQPVLLAASFDPTAPAANPVLLDADVLALAPATDQPWSSVELLTAPGAPGKVIVLVGGSPGTGLGRAHRLVVDAATHHVDLDQDLGGPATPHALATTGDGSESAWVPAGASEVNHYALEFLSEHQGALASAPILDCDAFPRPVMAAIVAVEGGFLTAATRCDGAATSVLAFGPFRDGAFLGAPTTLTLDFAPRSLALVPDEGKLWLVAADAPSGVQIRAVPLDASGAVLGPSVALGADPYATWVTRIAGGPVVGLATHEALTVIRPAGEQMLQAPQPPSTPQSWRSFITGAGLDQALLALVEEPGGRLAVDLYPCGP